MPGSPFSHEALFHFGPVPVAAAVATTWALMLLLAGACWLATRRLALRPGRLQSLLELYVGVMAQQARDTMQVEPQPYTAFFGGLFLFIWAANWAWLIPGFEPPTARLETDMALAAIVFVAVIAYGIRARGVAGYLKTYAEPTLLMVPLNLLETVTRTFSLVIRLFGNVMSGVFVVGILLSLAGLIVPIPLMALDLLTGAVQAYIFTILAMVFTASAVSDGPGAKPKEQSP